MHYEVQLDLSQNEFSGIIPDFRNLTNLSKEYVFFVHSMVSLSLQFSCKLYHVSIEDSLYLHHNDLIGSMPPGICALRYFELSSLTSDCNPSSLEVECEPTCCTACGDYDTDKNPFQRN